MSDDLKRRGPQDRSWVNLNEAWEMKWWCAQFNCSEEELREAVNAVGVSAEAVRCAVGVAGNG